MMTKRYRPFNPRIAAIGTLCIVIICALWAIASWILEIKGMKLGDWGDSFGLLATIFSGVGAIAVAATLYLQLEDSNSQEINSRKKQFDASFFELMKLIRELRSEIYFQHGNEYVRHKYSSQIYNLPPRQINLKELTKRFTGPNAIEAAYLEIRDRYQRYLDKTSANFEPDAAIQIARRAVFAPYEHCFAPYYRVIYSICRRINDEGILTTEEKIEYSRLVRGQLSSYDASLLGLNGLMSSSKDLGILIEEFRLLKYLKRDLISHVLYDKYDKATFKGRRPEISKPHFK